MILCLITLCSACMAALHSHLLPSEWAGPRQTSLPVLLASRLLSRPTGACHWLFWLASALNLAVLPFGATGFIAALPHLPLYLEQLLAWYPLSG